MSEGVQPRETRWWGGLKDNEKEIGRTPPTGSRYFMLVCSVDFAGQGMRVRMYLLQKRDAGVEYKRHLDVTTEVARDLWPLLRDGAALGGKVGP